MSFPISREWFFPSPLLLSLFSAKLFLSRGSGTVIPGKTVSASAHVVIALALLIIEMYSARAQAGLQDMERN